MQTPVNNKKAKTFLGMGAMQITICIMDIIFNTAATVMMAELPWYVRPG